jgi:hypothetical protein
MEIPQHFGDKRGPTCLMTGSHPAASIAMKIFIEQNQVLAFRILLVKLRITMSRAASGRLLEHEQATKSV